MVCFDANASPAESESDRVPLDRSLVKFVCTLCKKRFEEMVNPPSQVGMLVKGDRTSVGLYEKKLFTGHNDSLFRKASVQWQSALSIKPAPLPIKPAPLQINDQNAKQFETHKLKSGALESTKH